MKISDLNYTALDTETAFRLKAETEDGEPLNDLIEFGLVHASTKDDPRKVFRGVDREGAPCPSPKDPIVTYDNCVWGMCAPTAPITPESSATNNITDRDLVGFPGSDGIMASVAEAIRDKVVVIHNAEFDWGVLAAEAERTGVELRPMVVIDSLPIAQTLMPERAKHTLSVLGYAVGAPRVTAHRAVQDAAKLAVVFNALVERFLEEGGRDDLGDLLDVVVRHRASQVEPFDVIPFGKHRGVSLNEVPMGYMEWWFRKGQEEGKEPFYRADYSFAHELSRRKCPVVSEARLGEMKAACAKPITWPHLLPARPER
jgi:DNA polymerase III epsilon subunit-like protein